MIVCFNIEISMQKSAYLLVSATAWLNAGQKTIEMPLKHTQHFSETYTFHLVDVFVPCVTFLWHARPSVHHFHLLCHHSWLLPAPHQLHASFLLVYNLSHYHYCCHHFPVKSAYICPCNLQTQRTSYNPELKCICWLMLFTANTDPVSTQTYRCQGRIKLHTMSAMPIIHWDSTECTKLQFFNTATKNIEVYVELPVP